MRLERIGAVLLLGMILVGCENRSEVEKFSNKNYDNVSILKDRVRVVEKNGKMGVIDRNERDIIPIEYDNIKVVDHKIVAVKGEETSIFSLKGKEILSGEKKYILPNGNVYLEYKDKKVGILDKSGKEIVLPSYDNIGKFSNGVAIVEKNGKYGVIDENGNLKHPLEYKYIKDFINGMALVIDKDIKGGFINYDGKEVVAPKFKYTEDFNKNSTVVLINNKFGVIDKNGEYTIPLQDGRINSLEKDMYSVKVGDKFYLRNMYNMNISNVAYDGIGAITDGLISVKIKDKFGYITEAGVPVIKPSYTEIGEPLDGVIFAKDDMSGKFGLLDYTGKYVVYPKYEYVKARKEKMFIVGISNGKEGVINKKGKEIVPTIYDEVNFLTPKLVVAQNGDQAKIFILSKNCSKELELSEGDKIIGCSNNEILVKRATGIEVYKI